MRTSILLYLSFSHWRKDFFGILSSKMPLIFQLKHVLSSFFEIKNNASFPPLPSNHFPLKHLASTSISTSGDLHVVIYILLLHIRIRIL